MPERPPGVLGRVRPAGGAQPRAQVLERRGGGLRGERLRRARHRARPHPSRASRHGSRPQEQRQLFSRTYSSGSWSTIGTPSTCAASKAAKRTRGRAGRRARRGGGSRRGPGAPPRPCARSLRRRASRTPLPPPVRADLRQRPTSGTDVPDVVVVADGVLDLLVDLAVARHRCRAEQLRVEVLLLRLRRASRASPRAASTSRRGPRCRSGRRPRAWRTSGAARGGR